MTSLDVLINNEDVESEVFKTWKLFSFDSGVESSFIKGDNSIVFQSVQNEKSTRENKEIINGYIDSNKKKICSQYCKLDKQIAPAWIQDIESFIGN